MVGYSHPAADNEKKWIISAFADRATKGKMVFEHKNDWEPTQEDIIAHLGPTSVQDAIPSALRALVAEGILAEISGTPVRYRCTLGCSEHWHYIIAHDDVLQAFLPRATARLIKLYFGK